MAKFLVTFNDIIDESIEVSGFVVMTSADVTRFEELANSITWAFTYEFEDGSELHYSNGESFLSSITVKELNNDEVKSFKRLFNNEFGLFISETFLLTVIGEEDEDYDDFDEDDDIDITYDY